MVYKLLEWFDTILFYSYSRNIYVLISILKVFIISVEVGERMDKIYNKLVRDNIPSIIEASNLKAITRILTDLEYKEELEFKLLEEYNEMITASNKEDLLMELADMLEVIKAIAINNGSSLAEIISLAEKKAQSRGSFSKKIFLERVVSDETD